MLVKFHYKDGSHRILRPSETFFQRDNHKSIDIPLLNRKVEKLICDTGKCYLAEAYYGGTLLVRIGNEQNAPTKRVIAPEQYVKWREKNKKDKASIKKNMKNIKFTLVGRT